MGKKSKSKAGKRGGGTGRATGRPEPSPALERPSLRLAEWGAGKTEARPGPEPARSAFPSSFSFTRIKMLSPETRALFLRANEAMEPVLRARDENKVARIEQAGAAAELLDLLPLATGLGEGAWIKRVQRFGPEVIPLTVERLKAARKLRDSATRDLTYERLIAELRWRGEAGARALMEAFDDLDDYGKGVACVAMGRLGARAAADRMWDFYRQVVGNWRESYFVGALYGLVDLKDPRAVDALVDLLGQGRLFYELFGLLWLAGDGRAIPPMVLTYAKLPEERREEAGLAMAGIAHRLGRAILLEEMAKHSAESTPREALEALADKLLRVPAGWAEEYFASFHRGPNAANFQQAFRDMALSSRGFGG